MVPVETPRGLSSPPDLDRTPLCQDPTDTTENRTLTSGTLATMVRLFDVLMFIQREKNQTSVS